MADLRCVPTDLGLAALRPAVRQHFAESVGNLPGHQWVGVPLVGQAGHRLVHRPAATPQPGGVVHPHCLPEKLSARPRERVPCRLQVTGGSPAFRPPKSMTAFNLPCWNRRLPGSGRPCCSRPRGDPSHRRRGTAPRTGSSRPPSPADSPHQSPRPSPPSCTPPPDTDPPGETWFTPAARLGFAHPAMDGGTLIHSDLNPANLIVTPLGLRIVDWAWATKAAAWVELAVLIPWLTGSGHSAEQAEKWIAQRPAWTATDRLVLDDFASRNATKWATQSRRTRRPGYTTSQCGPASGRTTGPDGHQSAREPQRGGTLP